MSRTKAALKGVISSQLFMMVGLMLNIFSTPFILHNLESDIYGLSIIIFQIVGYLGMFDFGLTSGMVRYLALVREEDYNGKNRIQKIISTSFIIYTILGFTLCLFGLFLAPLAASIFNLKTSKVDVGLVVSIISAVVGIQFMVKALTSVFFAHRRQVLSNTIIFSSSILNTLLIILFIYYGRGLWSFVYSQIIVVLLSGIVSIYFFRKHYSYIKISKKDFDKKLLVEMFGFGFFIFLNGIAVQIIFQTDRILIGSLVSLSAVTIYTITARLPEIASQLIWKITDNALPAVIEITGQGSNQKFAEAHDKIMQISLSLGSACFWGILISANRFIQLWVGSQFFGGDILLIFICYLFLIHHTILHVTAICLNGAGFVKGFSIVSLFEAGINLTLSFILGNIYGVIGVVFATIIAGLVTSGWYVPYVAFKDMGFKIIPYLTHIFRPIIVCSLFGYTLYYFDYQYLLDTNNWYMFCIYLALLGILLLIPVGIINIKNFNLIFKKHA